MEYPLPPGNSPERSAVAPATPCESLFGSGPLLDAVESSTSALVTPPPNPLSVLQQPELAGSESRPQDSHVRERSDSAVGLQLCQIAMQSPSGLYFGSKQDIRTHIQSTKLQSVENRNPQASIPPRYGPAHRDDKDALARYAALTSDSRYKLVFWKCGAHLRPENVTMGRRQRSGVSFLDLPGEIRNQIYKYVFNFKQPHVPNHPARPVKDGKSALRVRGESGTYCVSATASCFSLLSLCRQTAFEAGTLFNFLATAYIPIHPSWDVFQCYQRLTRRIAPQHLHPAEHTVLAAFLRVKDLHLHLHLEARRNYSSDGPIMILLRVLQHLKGAKYTDRWGGQRRNITVHLDHYFADDCRTEVRLQQGSIHNIVTQMGKFEKANFTFAYYIHTGHDATKVPTAKWRNQRVKEFEDLTNRVKNHRNIKCIRPEIRGEGRWTELSWPDFFLEAVTTNASKQSAVWSSYPESLHGPDGMEERAKLLVGRSKTL